MSTSTSRKRKKGNDDMMELPVMKKEKRAARFKSHPSVDVEQRIARALNQRLYLISQEDKSDMSSDASFLSKSFAVLGSTGNVYDVLIERKPSCTCPDFNRGHLCKHILFVMLKVLRVPPHSPLVYQKALLQTELQDIFSNAPHQVSAGVSAKSSVTKAYCKEVLGEGESKEEDELETEDSPLDGECAVCFDAISSRKEGTACPICKNYLHTDCLRQWLKHSGTCVYCRSPLSIDSGGKSSTTKPEGYINLGDLQGQPRVRDGTSYSRYHYWN